MRSDGKSWIDAGFVVEGMIAVGTPLSVTFAESLGRHHHPGQRQLDRRRLHGRPDHRGLRHGNNGTYTIASEVVTTSTLTLTVYNTVAAEGPETATVSGALGTVSKISTSTLTLIDLTPAFSAALKSGTSPSCSGTGWATAPDFVFPWPTPISTPATT